MARRRLEPSHIAAVWPLFLLSYGALPDRLCTNVPRRDQMRFIGHNPNRDRAGLRLNDCQFLASRWFLQRSVGSIPWNYFGVAGAFGPGWAIARQIIPVLFEKTRCLLTPEVPMRRSVAASSVLLRHHSRRAVRTKASVPRVQACGGPLNSRGRCSSAAHSSRHPPN